MTSLIGHDDIQRYVSWVQTGLKLGRLHGQYRLWRPVLRGRPPSHITLNANKRTRALWNIIHPRLSIAGEYIPPASQGENNQCKDT